LAKVRPFKIIGRQFACPGRPIKKPIRTVFDTDDLPIVPDYRATHHGAKRGIQTCAIATTRQYAQSFRHFAIPL
jgi:hypothetical protein